MVYVNQNGKVIKETTASVSVNNRSFRYGDGCFETMKVVDGKLLFANYHFERLFSSLALLQFELPSYFTTDYLKGQVLALAQKNYHNKLARIRLMIYRGDGGLYDPQNHFPNYVIQTWDLNPANNKLNENGLIIDVFEDAVKHADAYSAIKSNNYLGYAMAALWVKKQHIIAKTPLLSEGGINGIMRRNLLEKLPSIGIEAQETTLTIQDLLEADELFLTNSIYGIRWVKKLKEKEYDNNTAALIFKRIISC